ncbi:MAG: glycosyltransferase [Lachnospiraceae bacterium]|nr:glycosyltransferase [Lachnospiraceae bacterium]
MKLLTIAVPCYNSQDYMEKCVESLVVGGDEVEVLVVNDGSADNTAAIADQLQERYPGIVRAIHQPNKGHGGAVNTGLENATGMYFKVVDSDDKVKASAFRTILDKLREYKDAEEKIDLLISNFVYDKEGQAHKKVMQYRSALPVNRMFTWDETRHFKKGQYILMHSVIYRTELLRECGLRLPEHCFYVDNIYVFNPMPSVKNMYYLDVNFYYYYIGRDDQSVNQEVMIRRLDQQAKVNRIMYDYFSDSVRDGRIEKKSHLYKYMYNYLEIITTITSVLAIISQDEEKIAIKDKLWEYLKQKNHDLYMKLKRGPFGAAVHLPGKAGAAVVAAAYSIAREIFGFN